MASPVGPEDLYRARTGCRGRCGGRFRGAPRPAAGGDASGVRRGIGSARGTRRPGRGPPVACDAWAAERAVAPVLGHVVGADRPVTALPGRAVRIRLFTPVTRAQTEAVRRDPPLRRACQVAVSQPRV